MSGFHHWYRERPGVLPRDRLCGEPFDQGRLNACKVVGLLSIVGLRYMLPLQYYGVKVTRGNFTRDIVGRNRFMMLREGQKGEIKRTGKTRAWAEASTDPKQTPRSPRKKKETPTTPPPPPLSTPPGGGKAAGAGTGPGETP